MKKAISLFLCFVILLSMFPTAVFAEGENGAQTETEIGDVSYSAENSLGTLLMRTLENEESDTSFPAVITDLSIDGTTASVELTTDRETDVVVAIYPDSETDIRMLGSGYTSCSAGRDVISMEIEIDEMPKYFIAAAYLLDAETHEPLSEQFISRYYTSEFQAFLATTTDDYDEELVLNLDGDPTTNFLVFSENTLQFAQTRGANELTDNGDGTYTIRNADERFRALQPGSSFAYRFGDGTLLIVVAATVQVDGNTVTISEDTEATLEQIFDYIRIEGNDSNGDGWVDMGSADSCVHLEADTSSSGLRARKIDITAGNTFVFEIEEPDPEASPEPAPGTSSSGSSWLFKGKLTFKTEATVKIYKSGLWFSALAKIDYSAALSAEIGRKFENKLLLGEPKIPLGASGVMVSFPLYFVVEGDCKLSFSGTLKGTIGASFASDSGFTNLTSMPSFEPKIEVSGKVFLGFEIEVEISSVIKKLIGTGINAKIGVEFTGKMQGSSFEMPSVSKRHDCKSCISGSVFLHGSVKLKFEALFGLIKNSCTVLDVKTKLFDCYFSMDFLELGFGTCPHINYLVTISAVDGNGAPLSSVKLSCPQFGQDIYTNEKGKAEVYLPNGEYTFDAYTAYLAGRRSITVHNEKKNVQIVLVSHGNEIDNGTCGSNLVWTLYEDGALIISGTGNMDDFDWTGHFSYQMDGAWKGHTKDIKYVIINDGITSIGKCAFYWCQNIKSIVIPDSVTSIGAEAFYCCLSLTSISSIPYGVSNIENKTFECCYELKNIRIPNTVVRIGDYAFCACKSLRNMIIPNSVISIGDYAFQECTSLTNILLPDGVTSIGNYSFQECSSLKSISIPNSVISFGNWVFYECDSLTSATLPNHFSSIPSHTFSHCSSLSSISFPQKVTTIGEGAFEFCSSLTNVTIPSSVTGIGAYAFQDCGSLQSLTIPNSVSSIGSHCFRWCTSLTTVTIPNRITRLEKDCFDHCINLKSIILPISLNRICSYCFSDCFCLCEIFYKGTQTQWESIVIENDNILLNSAVIHYEWSDITQITLLEEMCNDYGIEASTIELTSMHSFVFDSSEIELLSAFNGSTEQNGELRLAHFSDLVPGAGYVLLVMANASADNLLAADNLLYIAQGVADGSGNLTLGYIPRTESGGTATIYGISPRNLSDAEIQVEQLIGDSYRTTVRYQGVELTEGTDYKLTITEEGERVTVSVIGRDAYTGKQTVEGTRLCAVIFDANGGEEAPRPQAVTYGGDIVLTDSVPVRENCVFLGWAEQPEVEAAYHAGDTLTPERELTLYAVWLDLSAFDCILPDALLTIDDEAFFGCAFRFVSLPDGVESIGQYAFAESEALEYIYIPESVTEIAPDAFDKVEGLTIIGVPGSAAEGFAKQYGFSFIEG